MKPVGCEYIIDEQGYITGWQIVPLSKHPELVDVQMPTKEMNEMPNGLKDEYGNWKYVLVDGKPRIDLQPPTDEQKKLVADRQINQEYPNQLEIQRKAIDALIADKKVPKEYTDMARRIKEIEDESPE